MLLKPIRANVTWIYQCPICESELWVTYDEAKTKNYKVICCSEAHRIQRIRGVKVSPIFNEPNLKIVSVDNLVEQEVIEMMQKLGYTKIKARRLIKQVINKYGFITEKGKLLKLSLAEDSNEADKN